MTRVRNLSRCTPRVLPLAALALAFVVAGQGRAAASILQRCIAAEMEDVLAGAFDEQSSSGSRTENTPVPARPSDSPAPSEDEPGYSYDLLSPGTTGTSSSSGTSLGGHGAAQSCVMAETVSLDENPLVLRLALSQSLFLPTPPGVDLLRPPQFIEMGKLQSYRSTLDQQ